VLPFFRITMTAAEFEIWCMLYPAATMARHLCGETPMLFGRPAMSGSRLAQYRALAAAHLLG
jgi:hypothetical protein